MGFLSGCTDVRYSYGPLTLSREAYAGSYDLLYTTGYSGSTVEIFKNGVSIGSSGAGISLPGGTSNKLDLVVTNTEAAVRLTYSLVVIRKEPLCADSQLTQWSPAPVDV